MGFIYSPCGPVRGRLCRAILRHEMHLVGDVLSNGWGSAGLGVSVQDRTCKTRLQLAYAVACGTYSLLCVTGFPSQ